VQQVRSLAQSPPHHLRLTEPVTGHEIVAMIAQSHLDPQVLTTVCSILASDDEARPDLPCYLSAVARVDKIQADSQHDRGNGEAVKGQKDIPDSASGCVVDCHDNCKGVTVDEVKGNCVLLLRARV
jgi:hypothetical protein